MSLESLTLYQLELTLDIRETEVFFERLATTDFEVLAAEYGIRGILDDRLFDCSLESPQELELLKNTPASELGTCRYRLKDVQQDDTDYVRILEAFKKHNVRYFFYNGGNDSMDTCNKISKYMQKVGYECRIIGMPKTIDNDISQTDHCPGFGSAAKYIATSMTEISRDNRVYDKSSIVIVEMMGRNAGWLTASSALAGLVGEGPDLIYLPEVPFSIESFVQDIKQKLLEKPNILVAVSEGLCNEQGRLVSEYGAAGELQKDAFGHAQLGGLVPVLTRVAKEETGCKVRGIELSLLQRCAAHYASQTDIQEAYRVGVEAVACAEEGITDKMVGFERVPGEKYHCKTVLLPLEQVANHEKKVPLEWINESRNGILQPFLDYALPLIQGEATVKTVQGLPRFANLKRIFV